MDERNSNEIDLNQLFIRIVRSIKSHLVLLIVLVVFGGIAGFLYRLVAKSVYQSKMIATSGIFSPFHTTSTDNAVEITIDNSGLITTPVAEELIDNLNLLIQDGNIDLLSSKLGVSQEVASKIVGVEIKVMEEDRPKPRNLASEGNNFVIHGQVLDNQIFPELQKGIVHYMEHNEFLSTRINQRKNYYKELIEKSEKEIQDLENLKTSVSKGDLFSNLKGNVTFDPTVINSKILDLTKEKIDYENALALASSLQVIEGFNVSTQPSTPRTLFFVVGGAFIGLVIASAIIWSLHIVKEVRLHEENYPKASA